jgi:hypothetical protein
VVARSRPVECQHPSSIPGLALQASDESRPPNREQSCLRRDDRRGRQQQSPAARKRQPPAETVPLPHGVIRPSSRSASFCGGPVLFPLQTTPHLTCSGAAGHRRAGRSNRGASGYRLGPVQGSLGFPGPPRERARVPGAWHAVCLAVPTGFAYEIGLVLLGEHGHQDRMHVNQFSSDSPPPVEPECDWETRCYFDIHLIKTTSRMEIFLRYSSK